MPARLCKSDKAGRGGGTAAKEAGVGAGTEAGEVPEVACEVLLGLRN